jgi:hypothetical protein
MPNIDQMWWNYLAVIVLGIIGGGAAALIQDRGWASSVTTTVPAVAAADGNPGKSQQVFHDYGSLTDLVAGAVAAVIGYSLAQPTTAPALVAAALIAGAGGRVIVKGYVNGQASSALADVSKSSLNLAEAALTTATGHRATVAAAAQGVQPPSNIDALTTELAALKAQRAQAISHLVGYKNL